MVVDYMLVNCSYRSMGKGCQDVPGEEIVRHHLSVSNFKSLKARSVCSKGKTMK